MTVSSKLLTTVRLLVFFVLIAVVVPAHATNEALLELFKILRAKGSLTQQEYELLLEVAEADGGVTAAGNRGVDQHVDERFATVERDTHTTAWTQKIKIKGDLRTRYQYQNEDGKTDRSRGRIRYRLGMIARPSDGWEVGAGLASGGDDQRSTNQSFDETFSTKDINLDYAYLQYTFDQGFKAVAGKFPRREYLWAPTDVMWDSDINPEGFSLNYSAPNAWGRIFANTGIWVLEEEAGSSDDPYMVYGQLGQGWQTTSWFGTVAGAIYSFSDIDFIADITKSAGTNTGSQLGSFNLAAEIGAGTDGRKAWLVGEFINNYETDSSDDVAWALGARFSWDKWGFKYLYADVEANSVPDFLPDSNRFDGLTGIRGHELEVTYALMKNVKLGLDFYIVEDIATDVDQEVLQADLTVKF